MSKNLAFINIINNLGFVIVSCFINIKLSIFSFFAENPHNHTTEGTTPNSENGK